MGEVFSVEAVLEPAPPRLILRGEFDSDSIDEFDRALDEVLATNPTSLVLDLTDLRFLGSIGLSGFLRARSLVDAAVVEGTQPSVRRTFEVAGLDRFFTFVDA
jgi:anti-anti-sigma factor